MDEERLGVTEEQKHQFTLREYEELRSEMMDYVAEIRKLEIYAVVATALTYSFYIGLEAGKGAQQVAALSVPVWAWAIPIAFPLLSLIRGRAFYTQMVVLAEYLREVEEVYGRKPVGWEHFIERARRAGTTGLIGKTSKIFALILLLFTVSVFVWRLFRTAPQ